MKSPSSAPTCNLVHGQQAVPDKAMEIIAISDFVAHLGEQGGFESAPVSRSGFHPPFDSHFLNPDDLSYKYARPLDGAHCCVRINTGADANMR
jgi:hypothetical protein